MAGERQSDERTNGREGADARAIPLTKADYQARYWREVRKSRIAAGLAGHKDGKPGGGRPARTGYQPLIDFLAACPEPAITLTFAEIEAIIDAVLPSPAGIRQALGAASNSPSSRLLRRAGWQAQLDMSAETAHFTRDAS